LKQLLTKYEHGNTKYGATEVEKFQELRNKGLTVKQIITEMKLNTSIKTLSKFFQRNGIKKAKK
jgi:orotate phosphoribosyltransferase-like protein